MTLRSIVRLLMTFPDWFHDLTTGGTTNRLPPDTIKCGDVSWVQVAESHDLSYDRSLIATIKLCLHERLLAYLSPDTVTGDDGRHQNRCRGGCRLKWNMSQCLVRSDTVIYEAANQRPVDELLLTFSSLSHF